MQNRQGRQIRKIEGNGTESDIRGKTRNFFYLVIEVRPSVSEFESVCERRKIFCMMKLFQVELDEEINC